MQITDIFISNSNHLNEKTLKTKIRKVYSNNIEILKTELNKFKIFIMYRGKKEEETEFEEVLQLIVGNIISVDDIRLKADTMQSTYRKFIKTNKDNLALFRNIIGSSALFDISNNKIVIKTDLVSAIPVYCKNDLDNCISFSTHIDLFGAVDKNIKLDPVSAVEFLALGTVTYPYTIFQGVKQLPRQVFLNTMTLIAIVRIKTIGFLVLLENMKILKQQLLL